MNLRGKNLFEICEGDLQSLKEDKVPESRYIEYKSQLPGRTDADKKEFLADISSFANADGGDIIYGIMAKDGIPVEICGLQEENPEEQIQFLENLLRNGVEPHIPGVIPQKIDLSEEKGWALVVRIPKSWCGPHMVILQLRGHERFFGRDSSGRHAFDYHEIRDSFSQFGKNLERIQGFYLSRIEKIKGDYPLPLIEGPKAVFHLIPLSFLDPLSAIDLKKVKSTMESLGLPQRFGNSVRYNFDGIIAFEPYIKGSCSAYQFFRRGAAELVRGFPITDTKSAKSVISIDYLEESMSNFLKKTLELFKGISVMPPFFFWHSLLEVKGFGVVNDDSHPAFQLPDHRIDRNDLLLPEWVIEDFKDPIDKIVRETLDMVWNSAGYPGEWS